MAVRRITVRTIPGPGEPEDSGLVLGQMVDDGGTPFGTTPVAVEMLARDPRERFEYYYQGWSNGYVETKAA